MAIRPTINRLAKLAIARMNALFHCAASFGKLRRCGDAKASILAVPRQFGWKEKIHSGDESRRARRIFIVRAAKQAAQVNFLQLHAAHVHANPSDREAPTENASHC